MTSLSAIRSSLRLACAGVDRSARRLPGAEAARDMGDRPQAHSLRRLRRQRRALARRAEEHEALVGGEDGLVIPALRIDPEFEHAARAMEGARHAAVAVELANVAQVDEHDIVAPMQCERRLDRERLDRALGCLDQSLDMRGDVLWHRLLASSQRLPGTGAGNSEELIPISQ